MSVIFTVCFLTLQSFFFLIPWADTVSLCFLPFPMENLDAPENVRVYFFVQMSWREKNSKLNISVVAIHFNMAFAVPL